LGILGHNSSVAIRFNKGFLLMDARVQKMAQVIINFSCAVKPGELVLIRALSPSGSPLAAALYQEALRAGGRAFTYIHMSQEDSLAMEATDNTDLLSEPNPMLQKMYEECDVIIRIECDENVRQMSDYPQDLVSARLNVANTPLRIQMRREGAGELRRCTTQFPTAAYAQAAGMSLLQYEDFLFKACKVHLDDPVRAWRELGAFQRRLVDYLLGKKHLAVRGKNIDMEMSIENRTFISAEGSSNFPDGEIFTGPVEDSVNGWVNFTYPALYHGNEVLGAALTFEKGLVTKATARQGEAFLNKVLDTDPGARRLGEFAIGTNKDIQRFTGTILFDEKIGGTVHMAVGQGYPASGSHNQSQVHWDMICDMRDGGEILIDGQLFYRDGEFLI
jgi:aminopeptidase